MPQDAFGISGLLEGLTQNLQRKDTQQARQRAYALQMADIEAQKIRDQADIAYKRDQQKITEDWHKAQLQLGEDRIAQQKAETERKQKTADARMALQQKLADQKGLTELQKIQMKYIFDTTDYQEDIIPRLQAIGVLTGPTPDTAPPQQGGAPPIPPSVGASPGSPGPIDLRQFFTGTPSAQHTGIQTPIGGIQGAKIAEAKANAAKSASITMLNEQKLADAKAYDDARTELLKKRSALTESQQKRIDALLPGELKKQQADIEFLQKRTANIESELSLAKQRLSVYQQSVQLSRERFEEFKLHRAQTDNKSLMDQYRQAKNDVAKIDEEIQKQHALASELIAMDNAIPADAIDPKTGVNMRQVWEATKGVRAERLNTINNTLKQLQVNADEAVQRGNELRTEVQSRKLETPTTTGGNPTPGAKGVLPVAPPPGMPPPGYKGEYAPKTPPKQQAAPPKKEAKKPAKGKKYYPNDPSKWTDEELREHFRGKR